MFQYNCLFLLEPDKLLCACVHRSTSCTNGTGANFVSSWARPHHDGQDFLIRVGGESDCVGVFTSPPQSQRTVATDGSDMISDVDRRAVKSGRAVPGIPCSRDRRQQQQCCGHAGSRHLSAKTICQKKPPMPGKAPELLKARCRTLFLFPSPLPWPKNRSNLIEKINILFTLAMPIPLGPARLGRPIGLCSPLIQRLARR